MKPDDSLPEGSFVLARIEIVEYLDPDGVQLLSSYAADGNGEELDATRFLGIVERAKFESWAASQEDR